MMEFQGLKEIPTLLLGKTKRNREIEGDKLICGRNFVGLEVYGVFLVVKCAVDVCKY